MLIIIIVIIAVLVMIASFASDSNDSGPTQEDLDRWDEERGQSSAMNAIVGDNR
ncbi:hypothetical protein WDV13_02605 [Weissella cibaria]|uniref:hypothetical protein n=1 Tax=Weissella cibaria TaxID=137591 RepID=UPI00211DB4C3|nr:hypothetical protein [Weissella cibaria]MCQ9620434.1 hypothetical protein [Weissella cibaria]